MSDTCNLRSPKDIPDLLYTVPLSKSEPVAGSMVAVESPCGHDSKAEMSAGVSPELKDDVSARETMNSEENGRESRLPKSSGIDIGSRLALAGTAGPLIIR